MQLRLEVIRGPSVEIRPRGPIAQVTANCVVRWQAFLIEAGSAQCLHSVAHRAGNICREPIFTMPAFVVRITLKMSHRCRRWKTWLMHSYRMGWASTRVEMRARSTCVRKTIEQAHENNSQVALWRLLYCCSICETSAELKRPASRTSS